MCFQSAVLWQCCTRPCLSNHTVVCVPRACCLKRLSCGLGSFAGAQIRNTASVGGNIVTGSPISDVNPLYMAMGATFTVEGKGTEPRQIAANDFFLGYRWAVLNAGLPLGIVAPHVATSNRRVLHIVFGNRFVLFVHLLPRDMGSFARKALQRCTG